MSSPMGCRVDFVMANPRHHFGMYRPVLEWIQGRGFCGTRVVSLCELRGFETPAEQLRLLGAVTYRAVRRGISRDSGPAAVARQKADGTARSILRKLAWHTLIRLPWGGPREEPSLVVLPNDAAFPYDRIASLLRRRRIPFLLMQEGIRFELPGQRNGRRYGAAGARAVAAWGAAAARYFENVGVPTERIHPVGNPRLDALTSGEHAESARVMRAEMGLGDRMLLYISNPVDLQGFCTKEEKYALFASFLRRARAFLEEASFQLIFASHTSESADDYQRIVNQERLAERVRVLRGAPIYPLLHLAKGVIVLASTAGLEALLLDRPLGVLPTPGAGYVYDYVESGAALPLKPEIGLDHELARLVTDGAQRRDIRRQYVQMQVANVGRATEAVGELIMEQARQA